MHHSMKLYSRHRELFLRYYIWQAKWTRIPLVGRRVVDIAGEVALGPCSCRQVFRNCDNPIDTEIMVSLDRNAFVSERPQDYRDITRDQAKEILRDCHHRGLIHTIIRCRDDFYAICNCCNCCCVPLRLNKRYGIGKALARSPDIVAEFGRSQAAGQVDREPSAV